MRLYVFGIVFFWIASTTECIADGYDQYTETRASISFELLTLNLIKSVCRITSDNEACAGPKDGTDVLMPLWFFGQLTPDEFGEYAKKVSALQLDGEAAYEFSVILLRNGFNDSRYKSGFDEYSDLCVANYKKFINTFKITNVKIDRICKNQIIKDVAH